jgi:hypothetical protein
MRKLLLTLSTLVFLTASLQADQLFLRPSRAEHFFLPPRTLYHFRPDFYVYGHFLPHHPRWFPYWSPYHAYPSRPLILPAPRGIYRFSIPSFEPSTLVRVNTADLIFRVTPGNARVFVNDRVIGPASAFSTPRTRYTVLDGEHTIRIEYPGYRPFETVVQIGPNRSLEMDVELERKAGR